jgi:hypothetical protein
VLLRITYIREEIIQRDGHEFYDGSDGSDYGSDSGGGCCIQSLMELVIAL